MKSCKYPKRNVKLLMPVLFDGALEQSTGKRKFVDTASVLRFIEVLVRPVLSE